MTGDELCAAIIAELGFLTMACTEPVELGFVFRDWRVPAPLRVISASNKAEWQASHRAAQRILGREFSVGEKPFFYRVEAAD